MTKFLLKMTLPPALSGLFLSLLLPALALAQSADLAAVAPAPSEPGFCLQHFNTYGPAYAAQVAYRTDRLTRELLADTPLCDVIQFQEVWNSSQIDQIITALSPQYTISAPNQQARIGVMSLFRGNILKKETYTFNVNNEGGLLDGIRDIAGVQKAFHVVTAQLPQLPEEMYFLNTHLHPSSQAVRISQVLDIYNWRLQHQDKKLVMSGDFNAESDSLERKLLMSLLAAHDSLEEVMGHYPKDFCSYCESNVLSWLWGNHLFDYVFFSNVSPTAGVLKPKKGEINLKGEPYDSLSDHFGVRVYLELQKQENPAVDMAARKQQIFKILKQSIEILNQDGNAALETSVVELENISAQLTAEAGPHWSYWSQYR